MKTSHNRTYLEIDFDIIRENIEKLRKQTINPDTDKPFTREQFAKKAGLNLKTVNRWFEKNGNNPDIASLYRICNAYDCDLDYLTGRIDGDNHAEDSAMQYTGLSQEAVKALHDMSAEDTAIIDAFIRVCHDQKDALKTGEHGYPFINILHTYFVDSIAKAICEDPDRVGYKETWTDKGIEIEYADDFKMYSVWDHYNKDKDMQRFKINEQTSALLDAMLEYYSDCFQLGAFSTGDPEITVSNKKQFSEFLESCKESGKTVTIKE